MDPHERRLLQLAGQTPTTAFLWKLSNVLLHPIIKQFIFIASLSVTALSLRTQTNDIRWNYIIPVSIIVGLWVAISLTRFYLYCRVWLMHGIRKFLNEIWKDLSKNR